ncbi:MAG: hypothetical protein ABIO04_07595 [Ferruginibacter sp.]
MKNTILQYGCLALFCCITITGCNKDDKKILKEYYPSGKLKKSGKYIKSTIPVDSTFYYFENGNYERIEVRNDSGVLNGFSKSFHENGQVFQEIPYINNSVNGLISSYNEKGQLTSKLFYLDTRQLGDGYWFAETGNMSQYGFNGFGKDHRNFIKYDASGKISEKIAPFIFMDSVSTYMNADDKTYEASLLLSNPPNCRTSVLINYLSKDSIIKQQDSVVSKPYYFKKQNFPYDIYRIIFYGKQYDSVTGKTLLQNMTRQMRY